MSLLGLPCDLIREIIENWLQVVEWALIDSSLSTAKRVSYLEYLSNISFKRNIHVNRNVRPSTLYYLWISTRNIKLDTLSVSDEMTLNMQWWLSLDCRCLCSLTVDSVNEGHVIELVNRCSGLRSLELCNIQMGEFDISFKEVALIGLTSLGIYSCRCRPLLLQRIIECTSSLRQFRCMNTMWSEDLEWRVLSQNSSLELYVVNFPLFSSNLVLSRLNDYCPSMDTVFINSDTLDPASIRQFFACHAVKSFIISGEYRLRFDMDINNKLLHVYGISGNELSSIFPSFPSGLEELNLHSLIGINESLFLTYVLPSLTSLIRVDFDDIFEFLSVQTLRNVLDQTQGVKHVKLGDCYRYTEEEFRYLLCSPAPNWTLLELWRCTSVSTDVLVSFLQSAPRLKKLVVGDCLAVDKNALFCSRVDGIQVVFI